MARRKDFSLSREGIAETALALFREGGLDAVSTRKVAAELGASPMSLYVHVGSKEGLLDALAEHLMRSIEIDLDTEAPWTAQAEQWAHGLRAQLLTHPDVMDLLQSRRWAFLRCTEPLVRALLEAGFAEDAAVRAVRLLTWSTVGFLVVEAGAERLVECAADDAGVARSLARLHALEGQGAAVPASDVRGVRQTDVDALFRLQTRLLVEGLARDRAEVAKEETT